MIERTPETDDLTIFGTALFGPRWQSELSRELNVSDRTMRRWVAGPESIPPSVWPEIRALCARRGAVLMRLGQ